MNQEHGHEDEPHRRYSNHRREHYDYNRDGDDSRYDRVHPDRPNRPPPNRIEPPAEPHHHSRDRRPYDRSRERRASSSANGNNGGEGRNNPAAAPVENGKDSGNDLNLTAGQSTGAWEDDKMDMLESWADDRPVNWNEKIVFSDEDGEKNRDWAEPEPNDRNEPDEHGGAAGYGHGNNRGTHYRRDYDHRYDNRYDSGSGSNRNTHNNYNRYNNNSYEQQNSHRGYDEQRSDYRRHQREDRNSRNYDDEGTNGNKSGKRGEGYHRYQQPQRVERGFYDDYERGNKPEAFSPLFCRKNIFC